MRKLNRSSLLLLFLVASYSCSNDAIEPFISDSEMETENEPEDATPDILEVDNIPANTQRSGDVTKGYNYLISGDYMNSGIPYAVFLLGFGEDNTNLLNRSGDNAVIPSNYTAVTAANGVRVVGPNCMSCHAAKINDEFIIGLGSHDSDFTVNRADNIMLLNSAISTLYGGEASDEWKAYDQFRKSIIAIGPTTMTETRGVNPADKITQVLIAHRDKTTLEWLDTPNVELDNEVFPTDVPAWWLLKKKNAMFFHAIGRKDFCKSFIGSSLLTLTDASKAEEVDQNMVDVLAYINSIEPPVYPFAINTALASEGKPIFEKQCVKCHGSYGANSSYPNLLVSLKTIGTDPELSNHYTEPSAINDYFMDWFNTGWFGTSSNPLEIKAIGGYIAPPLDGIWATAPYFHNASVPSLEDVLSSQKRPKYWSRTYLNTDYNQNMLGWNYTVENTKINKNTYDTTLKGYSNEGHTFGDGLTNNEKKALLEYLKTL